MLVSILQDGNGLYRGKGCCFGKVLQLTNLSYVLAQITLVDFDCVVRSPAETSIPLLAPSHVDLRRSLTVCNLASNLAAACCRGASTLRITGRMKFQCGQNLHQSTGKLVLRMRVERVLTSDILYLRGDALKP